MSRRERRAQKREEETLVDLTEVRDNAQDFLESNQKLIMGVATAIILLFGGYLAYQNFIRKPKMKQVKEEIYHAERQFLQDSFALALTNPGGGQLGFLDIIDQYGGTPTGNTAKYYAGVSYLQLGQYEKAIEYLNMCKPTGDLLPALKFGSLGDAYSELNEFDKAISSYKKAVTADGNDALKSYYLKKLGLLSEHQGDSSSALKAFKEIRDKHGDSPEAENIEKYIARLEA